MSERSVVVTWETNLTRNRHDLLAPHKRVSLKSPSVSEATSFIWPASSMRSFTAHVCSARAPSSTPLMRAIWSLAHSPYGKRMVCACDKFR